MTLHLLSTTHAGRTVLARLDASLQVVPVAWDAAHEARYAAQMGWLLRGLGLKGVRVWAGEDGKVRLMIG